MKKIEASGSREWEKLEQQDSARIVAALLDLKPFMDQIKSRTRYQENNNPVKRLCCPKGHEIIRLQLEVDLPMLITGKQDWKAMSLKQAGEESDNYVPTSKVLVKATDQPWGKGASKKYTWACAYKREVPEDEDPNLDQFGGCRNEIAWGGTFCEAHKDAPEPEGLNHVWDTKVSINCPMPGCIYDGEHRSGSLLVLYAAAVLTRQRKMKLDS